MRMTNDLEHPLCKLGSRAPPVGQRVYGEAKLSRCHQTCKGQHWRRAGLSRQLPFQPCHLRRRVNHLQEALATLGTYLEQLCILCSPSGLHNRARVTAEATDSRSSSHGGVEQAHNTDCLLSSTFMCLKTQDSPQRRCSTQAPTG